MAGDHVPAGHFDVPIVTGPDDRHAVLYVDHVMNDLKEAGFRDQHQTWYQHPRHRSDHPVQFGTEQFDGRPEPRIDPGGGNHKRPTGRSPELEQAEQFKVP